MRRSAASADQESPEIVYRDRTGVLVSLEIASVHAYALFLIAVILDTFKEDGVVEAVEHLGKGGDHEAGGSALAASDKHDAVKFDDIEWDLHDPFKVGVTRTEVIEVELYAKLTELEHTLFHKVEVLAAAALGDLHGDFVIGDTVMVDNFLHLTAKGVISQVENGEINGNTADLKALVHESAYCGAGLAEDYHTEPVDDIVLFSKWDELIGVHHAGLGELQTHKGFGSIVFSGSDVVYGLAVHLNSFVINVFPVSNVFKLAEDVTAVIETDYVIGSDAVRFVVAHIFLDEKQRLLIVFHIEDFRHSLHNDDLVFQSELLVDLEKLVHHSFDLPVVVGVGLFLYSKHHTVAAEVIEDAFFDVLPEEFVVFVPEGIGLPDSGGEAFYVTAQQYHIPAFFKGGFYLVIEVDAGDCACINVIGI